MKKGIFLIFLIILFLMTGCSQTEIQTDIIKEEIQQEIKEIEEFEPSTPVAGGELNLSMRMVQTLNPLLNAEGTVDTILKLIYMPLIKIDENFKPSPSIAESWSFSEDGRSITIKLKDNIYWQNGSSITAEDVTFSINTIRSSPENTVYKKCMNNVQSTQIVNSKSLVINFYSSYIGNIYSMNFPVISSAYYRNAGAADSQKNMTPMGSGAYTFVSYTPAKEMCLVKSDNSFGINPYIESIKINITHDKDTDLYSISQGIIDALCAEATEIGRYSGNQNNNEKFYSTNYFDFIGFNFNRLILQDKNVRKAVAFAVPKTTLAESVYLGHAISTDTIINPESWLYNDNVQKYEYNLPYARQLLESVRWLDSNGDGIRERTTNELIEVLKVSILVNTENNERKQVAEKLGAELKSIGFDVYIDSVSYEEYIKKLETKDYDIFIGGWDMSVIPDYSFMLHSAQTSNGTNFAGYSNEEMDLLLHYANVAIGDENLKAAYYELQKYEAEEIPYIPLFYRESALFTTKRIKGNINPIQSNIFDNIDNWYIENN